MLFFQWRDKQDRKEIDFESGDVRFSFNCGTNILEQDTHSNVLMTTQALICMLSLYIDHRLKLGVCCGNPASVGRQVKLISYETRVPVETNWSNGYDFQLQILARDNLNQNSAYWLGTPRH